MTKAEILQKLLEKKGLKKQPAPRIPKRPNDAAPRLSFAQQRLWFVQQMAPGSTAYNLPAAWDIEGPFDIERLRTAFRKVIERHEILRTRFPTDGHTIELSINNLAGNTTDTHRANGPCRDSGARGCRAFCSVFIE